MRTSLLIYLSFFSLAFESGARSPMTLQSTSLGAGLFRYTIRIADDPFFYTFEVPSFSIWNLAGVQLTQPPVGWTNSPASSAAWAFADDRAGAQARPYEASFLVRSSLTSFKKVSLSAAVAMSLRTIGPFHGYSEPLVGSGYWNPDLLVPCPPEEADGSSTNIVARHPWNLPDIRISSVRYANGRPLGIDYEYTETNTVRLEATRDFNLWTNVAYIYGTRGVTSWTHSQPLDLYGSFYRVRLMAEGHAATLPPLNSAIPMLYSSSAGESADIAAKSIVRPVDGGLEITMASKPGSSYRVELLDFEKKLVAACVMTAMQSTSSVVLPVFFNPAGLIRIAELPEP